MMFPSTLGVLMAAITLCSLSLTSEAQSTKIYHICNSTTNFSLDSTNGTNLNERLLPNLNFNTRKKWFFKASVSTKDPSNASYSLFLCRGNVSPADCSKCVAQAELDIRQWCGEEREAIIWYDKCMLRYANRNSSQR